MLGHMMLCNLVKTTVVTTVVTAKSTQNIASFTKMTVSVSAFLHVLMYTESCSIIIPFLASLYACMHSSALI